VNYGPISARPRATVFGRVVTAWRYGGLPHTPRTSLVKARIDGVAPPPPPPSESKLHSSRMNLGDCRHLHDRRRKEVVRARSMPIHLPMCKTLKKSYQYDRLSGESPHFQLPSPPRVSTHTMTAAGPHTPVQRIALLNHRQTPYSPMLHACSTVILMPARSKRRAPGSMILIPPCRKRDDLFFFLF